MCCPSESPYLLAVLASSGAFVVSAAMAWALSLNAIPFLRIHDVPNERSLHLHPVPRTGGVAVVTGSGLALAAIWPTMASVGPLGSMVLAALLVAVVSLIDDRRHVSPIVRLLAHATGALVLYRSGLQWDSIELPGLVVPLPDLAAMLLTLAYVVWMTNLYNFMDGLDGFAGGMAVLGLGALALLGWLGEAPAFATVAVVIAAAASGFLTRNLPPARLFLGDVGSSTLGLVVAAMTLWGSELGLFPLWAGWLVFSPFIVDATWTLLRRVARHESFWTAHRSHHYQRLVLAGWGHRRVLLWSYVLMAAAAASAVGSATMSVSEQWLLLLGWSAVYAMIHVRVGLAERVAEAARP